MLRHISHVGRILSFDHRNYRITGPDFVQVDRGLLSETMAEYMLDSSFVCSLFSGHPIALCQLKAHASDILRFQEGDLKVRSGDLYTL